MSHVFQVPVRVRGYECSVDRTVPLPVVLSYMEHCRWVWILDPSLGLVEGLHTGHFFVVHRQTVALARTFGIDTRATVRAALRTAGRVSCEVDQDLVRDDGVLLARARITAVWLGPGGRMARIPDATRQAVTDEPMDSTTAADTPGRARSFLAPDERNLAVELERKLEPGIPEHAASHALVARRSHCDMFGHVNGSHYLRMFEDVDGTHAHRADIEYRGQAVAGDALVVRTWDGPGGRCHALQRGDETLCRAVLAST